MPISLQATRAQLELKAFLLELCGLHRMFVIHGCRRCLIPRLLVIALTDQMLAPGIFGAALLPLRRFDVHVGEIDRLLRSQHLASRIDALTLHGNFHPGERGLFPCQLIAQFRAVDLRERLAFLHRIARLHDVMNRSGGDRKQRRAHCCDDSALCRHIANELAARDLRDTHTLPRHRYLSAHPAAHQHHDKDQQCERPNGAADQQIPALTQTRRLIDRTILCRSVANARDLLAIRRWNRGDHRRASSALCGWSEFAAPSRRATIASLRCRDAPEGL